MAGKINSVFCINVGLSVTGRHCSYKVIKILHYRSFVEIAECIHESTGEVFVIKFIKNIFFDRIAREMKTLKDLRAEDSHKYNIIHFIESFPYKDLTCFVFQRMHLTLSEMILDGKRFSLPEIRGVAYQMLVALKQLNACGYSHNDINPHSIMSLDESLQLFNVKLISFANAQPIAQLSISQNPLVCGYTAPEVYLDGPLNERVDIWSLACVLGFLFLGKDLFSVDSDYKYIKDIVDLFGQPEKHLLDTGSRSRRFFQQIYQECDSWRFKSPEEFQWTTGSEVKGSVLDSKLTCLDDLVLNYTSEKTTDKEDMKMFFDLLKLMLNVDPALRISVEDSLNHPFITTKHLNYQNTNYWYMTETEKIMKECRVENSEGFYSSFSHPEKEIDDSEVEEINLRLNSTIKSKSNVYRIETPIGQGAFGEVARCRIEGTNKHVAVKISRKENACCFLREAKALQRLNNLKHYNEYFIRLNDCFAYQDCFCLDLELLRENLYCFDFKVSEMRVIAQQLLKALNALKHLGIIHTDIKPDNIMTVNGDTEPLRVKLIDFGMAYDTKYIPQDEVIQTIGYIAPEVIFGLPRDEAIDMWSLGCVLAEVFLRFRLFPQENEYDHLRMILKFLGQPDKRLLEKGIIASQYFTKEVTRSDPSWKFKTLDEYQKKNGKVSHRPDPKYDDITSLEDLFFSKNTDNSTENEDIKAFLDLLKKMLTWDPADRILPADALKHPFITMKHLDGASDMTYVREARRIFEQIQTRGSSETPSDPDLDGCLPKVEFDESASSSTFNPEEVLWSHYNEKERRRKNIDAKETKINLFKTNQGVCQRRGKEKHLVQTGTKKTPHPDLSQIPPNHEDLNELFSCFKMYEATSITRPLEIKQGVTIKGKSNDYLVEKILGAGAYGQVSRCRIEGTNQVVALKTMRTKYATDFFKEAKTLKRLNNLKYYNNYFVRLNDCFAYRDYFCQELELLDKDLYGYFVDSSVPFQVAEIRAIAHQMLEALSALRQLGISHTDVKPENIMLVNCKDQTFRVKLIDFGLAFENKDLPLEHTIQTLGYRAPEVILGLPRNEAIDTWSLGCVLSELFLRKFLFPRENKYDNLRLILKLLGRPDYKLLDKGILVPEYFTQENGSSGPFWIFKSLYEYEIVNGKVYQRADPEYNEVRSLDKLFFPQGEKRNPTETADIKALLDLVKKMLTWDPADRILPADALKHPFLTMEHLDGASDRRYVREARRIMKQARCRKPGNHPSACEKESTSSTFNPEDALWSHYNEIKRREETRRKNIDDKETKTTSLRGTNRECTGDEEQENPSLFVQTKTRRTSTSGNKKQIKPTVEREKTPHPDPSKTPNHRDLKESLSDDKMKETTSGRSLSVEARTVETKEPDVNNQTLEKATEREINESDLEKIDLTQTDSTPFELRPGYRIEGKSNIYIVEGKLGAGEHGQVVRCRIEGTNKIVALKILRKTDAPDFLNEATTLQRLNNLKYYNNYFIRLNDCFVYQEYFCLELELLDENLMDFIRKQGVPFKVAEIRAIAQQMLVALSALKQIGFSHTDIKPDNIMFVNHKKQPFRVKLIDFGSVWDTDYLPQTTTLQDIPYRAPEVILGCPRDEAIDTWSLGCVLSTLLLGHNLFPPENEYDHLRLIVELLGQPDKELLKEGTLVSQYFTKKWCWSGPSWTFKTLKEYQKQNGEVSERADSIYNNITSLDELFLSGTNSSTETEDIKAFLDLVKKMLTWNPADRILPADALKHPFITMEHLDGASDRRYVRKARRLMKQAQCKKPGNNLSEGERENTSRPGSSRTPSDPLDLDGCLPKVEFDQLASGSNFIPKELVKSYFKEKKKTEHIYVKKKTLITRVKTSFTRMFKH